MLAPASSRAAALVTLLGLATTAIGVFALPLQPAGDLVAGQEVSFVVVRQRVAGSSGGSYASGFGEFWWRYGLLLALALILLGVCLLVLDIAARTVGIALVVVGILTLAGQGAALAQTISFQTTLPPQCNHDAQFCLVHMSGTSLYDNTGDGIWVAYAGLCVVVAGGLLSVLTGRRRAV